MIGDGGGRRGEHRIEREIHVDAPPERVWELVNEDGWWIGDGDRSGQVVRRDGDVAIVEDPRYGRWAVLRVSAERPHHVAYRGCAFADQLPSEENSTLVEFFLSAVGGGTRLRVVESGFDRLALSPEGQAEKLEGNAKGWEFQLDVAKRDTEQA